MQAQNHSGGHYLDENEDYYDVNDEEDLMIAEELVNCDSESRDLEPAFIAHREAWKRK